MQHTEELYLPPWLMVRRVWVTIGVGEAMMLTMYRAPSNSATGTADGATQATKIFPPLRRKVTLVTE